MLREKKNNTKWRYFFILFWVIISTNHYNQLFSLIKDQQKKINRFNSSIKEARSKIADFYTSMRKAEAQINKLRALLKEYKVKVPANESSQYGYQFLRFDNGITIYKSDKGIGIKIDNKEKLFQKKNSFTYQLIDKYQLKNFTGQDGQLVKQVFLPQYHFWKRQNLHGFKKLNKEGDLEYKYYAKLMDKKIILEKLTLSADSYCRYVGFGKQQSIYYRFNKDMSMSIMADKSILARFGKEESYIFYFDGNISFSPFLERQIFKLESSQKRQYYIRNIIRNFPASSYSEYLRVLEKANIPLNQPGFVYLTLINYERKKYALPPLTNNKTLNKIGKAHVDYLRINQPANTYYQTPDKKGYFGKTPFQRRKFFKYPYRVVEWLAYGDNYIRNFMKAMSNMTRVHAFLNPNAHHFGFHYFDCKKIGREGSFSIIIIGRKSPQKPVIFIYPQKQFIYATVYQIKIIKKMPLGIRPKIKTYRKGNFLFLLLVYHETISIKKIQVKVNGKNLDINHQQKRQEGGKTHIIYSKNFLIPGATYHVKIHYQIGGNRLKTLKKQYTIRHTLEKVK